MTLYPCIYSKTIFPLFSIISGTQSHKHLKSLQKTQGLSREDIDSMQNARLREIVQYSCKNVPYYKRVFRELSIEPERIRTPDDLSILPVLTKDIIREKKNELMSIGFREKKIDYQTGGSTGEPLSFIVTEEMLSHASAARYRAWGWAGFKPGDKSILLWGSDVDLAKHRRLPARLKHRMQRVRMFDAFSLDENRMESIASLIQHNNGFFMRSYASSAELLAKYVIEKDMNACLRGVVTTAETLMPEQRSVIEKAFRCKVYDGYGSRETSLIAHECHEHHGYHISEENSVVEVVRDGRNVVGEEGAILITDLHNHAMPFIRYNIEDAAIMKAGESSCGINLARLDRITGRINDIITTPDGKYLHGEAFTHIFYDYTSVVKKFQVIQKDIDRFLITMVPQEGADTEGKLKEIEQLLKDMLGETVSMEFSLTENIPVGPSGKHRFTISEVPVKFT